MTAVLAEGVTYECLGNVSAADTQCDEPEPVDNCAIDPSYPGFAAPPKAPRVPDPGAPAPVTYTRTVMRLEPNVVPTAGVGAVRLVLANLAVEKRGIRVRMWTAESADFESVPECGFVNEFTVRYLESSAQIIVDAAAGTVTVLCIDGTLVNATSAVRGPYGGAFVYPLVSCDRRYFIAVDVPVGQGALEISLSVALREG